jgi:hypothetical protein
MTPALSALGLALFGAVTLAALRRVLPQPAWEVTALAVVLTGLILAALYAPEIDGPAPRFVVEDLP